MKRPGVDGGFLLCFILNLFLNIGWLLPAVILLILHFVVGTPLWLFFVALALWVVIVLLMTIFMSWAARTGDSDTAGTGVQGKNTVRYSSDSMGINEQVGVNGRASSSRNEQCGPDSPMG